ncbi:MAG: hypothetical protein ACM3JD_07200 [Rudaea sp.]
MKTDRDILSPSQRFGGLAAIPCMLALLAFFALHQLVNSGFFTARFGPWEMLALYGPILVSSIPPIARAIGGRRNSGRPFEVASNISLAIGSLWLVTVFPFDYAHLADVLPGPIQFVLSWISDDIARIVLTLQVIIGAIVAFLTAVTFFSFRRRAAEA